MHDPSSPACRALLTTLSALTLAACLPEDTRPPPGVLRVNVRGTQAATALTTSDGFDVHFERFLVTLGPVHVHGSDCDSYAEPQYDRIIDASQPEPQKLNDVYALGSCELGFRLAGPSSDTLLTKGVSETDKTRLRTTAKNALGDGKVAIEVVGSASDGVSTKRFAWSFREHVFYSRCPVPETGQVPFELSPEKESTWLITLHAEALFMSDAFDRANPLSFEPFALADDETGNGDGQITTEELALAPAPATAEPGVASLAELLRTVRFPTVARVSDSEPCKNVSLDRPLGEEGP